jgi:hypothetical protein
VLSIGGVSAARGTLGDGRQMEIVWQFWRSDELEQRLHSSGWEIGVRLSRVDRGAAGVVTAPMGTFSHTVRCEYRDFCYLAGAWVSVTCTLTELLPRRTPKVIVSSGLCMLSVWANPESP